MIYVKNCLLLLLLTTNMPRITGKYVMVENEFEDEMISSSADENDITTSSIVVTTRKNPPPTSFEIPYSKKPIVCTSLGSTTTQLSLIFTQGALANFSSPTVQPFVEGFSELKKIIYFQGRGNLQSRTKMFKTVIEHHHCNVIGGRSMGARVAISTAKETKNMEALILVSFPLRSRKGESRIHLLWEIDEGVDVLFVIGSRDELCDLNELRRLTKQMKVKTWIIVVNDANHLMELSPSKAIVAVGKMVGNVVARWIEERNETLTNCYIQWNKEQNDVIVGPWSDGL